MHFDLLISLLHHHFFSLALFCCICIYLKKQSTSHSFFLYCLSQISIYLTGKFVFLFCFEVDANLPYPFKSVCFSSKDWCFFLIVALGCFCFHRYISWFDRVITFLNVIEFLLICFILFWTGLFCLFYFDSISPFDLMLISFFFSSGFESWTSWASCFLDLQFWLGRC